MQYARAHSLTVKILTWGHKVTGGYFAESFPKLVFITKFLLIFQFHLGGTCSPPPTTRLCSYVIFSNVYCSLTHSDIHCVHRRPLIRPGGHVPLQQFLNVIVKFLFLTIGALPDF